MRTIDADALIESIKRQCGFCKLIPDEEIRQLAVIMEKGLIEEVNNAPTIEPKRGEWIPCTKSGLTLTELMRREGQKWYGYRCSNCNHIYKGNALTDYNFCPNCGASMKGADDE